MLPWIDALRGLAILMVLANHVALVIPGLSAPVLALARFGQMGVQLFFVASAFTLCLSWQQRRHDEPLPVQRFLLRRVFRRGPWENAATAAIAVGVVMMMQPFWLWAYSNSFGVILTGTVGFIVVSKFPE